MDTIGPTISLLEIPLDPPGNSGQFEFVQWRSIDHLRHSRSSEVLKKSGSERFTRDGRQHAFKMLEASMSDDKARPRPQDPQRINLQNENELEYWTHLFGCTRPELEAAVKNVGVMAVDVERELQVLRS